MNLIGKRRVLVELTSEPRESLNVRTILPVSVHIGCSYHFRKAYPERSNSVFLSSPEGLGGKREVSFHPQA